MVPSGAGVQQGHDCANLPHEHTSALVPPSPDLSVPRLLVLPGDVPLSRSVKAWKY